MQILVVNAGSSGLKLRLLDHNDGLVASEDVGATRDLGPVLSRWEPPDAVGHRIVHGGTRFTSSVRVTQGVVEELKELIDLAPLHLPRALEAIAEAGRIFPDAPVVACFDTAFHSELPAPAATYALPRRWRDTWNLRRFGFHGLSHSYAARRAAALLGRSVEELRLVTCHLGAGASLAAVKGGASVDTTMGFTPLEGLVMATRSGTVDPGLVLWLETVQGIPAAEISRALEHESGLLGLSGTADMEEVVLGRSPEARLALEVYVHRLCASIAAMASAMRGVDGVVFTGGVGENAVVVRERCMSALDWMGCAVDTIANERARGDAVISPPTAKVGAVVVSAREDLEIAREVRRVLR
ncbi:MAG: acetate/propionate family kinase [Actinomycetota bacterium]|nr:acetate/propionate family kinase [Actinomycetota bacterium]